MRSYEGDRRGAAPVGVDKTSSPFNEDRYPGSPRILFLGPGDSSHTHSWIDLLKDEPFNVRLFTTSHALPPDRWDVQTYVTNYVCRPLNPENRARLSDNVKVNRLARSATAGSKGRLWNINGLAGDWLVRIISEWRPHIIHTFGLESAGEFYFNLTQQNKVVGVGKWVLQVRGGSDMQLAHLVPKRNKEIARVLRACDQILSDNQQNFTIARAMGVREDQLSSIGTVPGTGGIDVASQERKWKAQTSERRMILWPKVYECRWSKAIPVYEALKQCWDRIQPCEVHLLATTPRGRLYFWTLPKHIRAGCLLRGRIPRSEVLEAMTQARVMLAPSLVDGTPNAMFEAMASGAFPIVSPLETIRSVVGDENVAFARNLYPEEIANALVRAMSDDRLVDAAAEKNLELVRRIANRAEIRTRVVAFYEELADSPRSVGRTAVGLLK
jgi:glycosyl transferase family 1